MLSSFFRTGRFALRPKTPSRQANHDNRANFLKGPGRDVQRLTSHGGTNAHETVQQPKRTQIAVDGFTSTTSNHSPIPNNDEPFGPDVGLHVHQEDFDVPTIHNLIRQGTLRQPPTTNMARFKYYIESFHYPVHVSREPTMLRVDVPRNIEWHIQLRHFFVDLDQQLQELEHYLSSSSSSDDNTNLTDTAALANWTSYEIPNTELGPAIWFYRTDPIGTEPITRLRCSQRRIFSQRSAKGDGKQLTGRWLVVAYVFASTPEAMFNMDVKTLLSTGCSGTMTAAHGTGSCSGAGPTTHYNTDTMLALRAQSWDPHNCIRSGDGPATGTFYQLERRKKLASELYIYRYGGGGGITTSTTTTTTTTTSTASTPILVEIEDKAADTTITSTTTTTKKTVIVGGTGTGNPEDETEMFPTVYYDPYLRRCRPGETNIDAVPIGVPIPQELEDRCHRIDRLWPALMTGQYTVPPQATTDLDGLVWDWTDDQPNTSTE
uniref:Resistant to spore killer n=1 Tax=Neurospora crassa TaxID=5141 RepID=I6W7Y2_NEUCS|nr:resistant to spore killer [Neurospora crassa]